MRMGNQMKRLAQVFSVVLIVLCIPQNVLAQGTLALSINRDFGYGGFDNKIEGLFSLTATGPENLTSVDFYIDDKLIATIEQPPFRFQFSTNSYSPGDHRLSAVGHTSSGEELRSNEITRVFLTKDESRTAALGLILPMLGIVLIVMFAVAVVPALFGRKEKVGDYGILGGTVCPNCGLSFSLKMMSINWIGGKFQRCPHCGKWSVVRRAAPETLAAAEARWRGDDLTQVTTKSSQERTRRQIDDSRYEK